MCGFHRWPDLAVWFVGRGNVRSRQMAQIFYDADLDIRPLLQRRIGIIGYGNQGRAQALNLRDSGCQVRVGLRPDSPRREQAATDGFDVLTVADTARWSDMVCLLLPDQVHRAVYETEIKPVLGRGDLLLVAH